LHYSVFSGFIAIYSLEGDIMKKQWLNIIVSIMLIAGLGVMIHACGGGSSGGGQSTIQLSGTVASGSGGYTVAMTKSEIYLARALSFLGFASPAYAVGEPEVNRVLAIPMESGSLTSWNMQNAISQTINSDGTFSLSLSDSYDWLLMLINSQATGTDKFVGSIAVKAGSDSLLNLPATDATISSIDLGTLSRATTTTTDALSSGAVTAGNFNMTAAQLTAMAKSDDLFRNAMNIVNNYGNAGFGNAAAEWYTLRPDFSWLDSSTTLTSGFSHPDNMIYSGMNFQLDTNTTNVAMDDVCNTAGYVALHPPQAIVLDSVTYDYSTPIKNSGLGCTQVNSALETADSVLYASNAYEGKITYSVLGSTTDAIPSGFWEWKENGVTKAAFEVGNVNPPVTNSGKAKGFVPSYKLNVEAGTKKILSVDVQWYYYDETTGSYVLVTNNSVLKHFISGAEVKFDVGMGVDRKTCEMYFDPATTTHIVPSTFATTNCSLNWYYGNTSFPNTNTGVMGFYESGGFGYFFHYSAKP
jgi:hypothetical protein